jgi:hypothetical protein
MENGSPEFDVAVCANVVEGISAMEIIRWMRSEVVEVGLIMCRHLFSMMQRCGILADAWQHCKSVADICSFGGCLSAWCMDVQRRSLKGLEAYCGYYSFF